MRIRTNSASPTAASRSSSRTPGLHRHHPRARFAELSTGFVTARAAADPGHHPECMFRRSRTSPDESPRSPRMRSRRGARRPSLTLWRHRHLVIALCLGAAATLALSALRPGAEPGQEALVVARTVGAGEVITADDLATRSIPSSALPADGMAGSEVIGSRAAIELEKGTVLTASMTSAAIAADLAANERLVQVPVEVGAQLAVPGAHVDVIGEAPPRETNESAGSSESAESPGPAGAGESPSSASASTFNVSPSTEVLCRNARVVLSTSEGEDTKWAAGRKVTLITLAVPAANASLIVGAATNGALGVVLSP